MSPAADSLWVSTTEAQLNCISGSVDTLQCRLNTLQVKTEMLSSIISTSNDSIGNQLAATGILLAIIGFIITVACVILGIYIGNKKKEIEEIRGAIEKERKEVKSMADATKVLDKQIHGNLRNLYKDLRKEETNALLDRLVLEPKDITNLIKLLLARELEETSFPKLREAYLRLIHPLSDQGADSPAPENNDPKESYGYDVLNGDEYKKDYVLLFFQHFCKDAVKDPEIRPALISGFPQTCRLAFKRDIIKSTIDLCRALSEEDSTFNKEEVLTFFLKALNNSVHCRLTDLRNILEQNISPQSLLKGAIECCTKENVFLALFDITGPTTNHME